MIKTNKIVSLLLRIGLVIVFLYAAIASFIEPSVWISFFPNWLKNIISANILLFTFSIYEIVLSLWLLSGKKTFYAAILSSLTLLAIIIFNLDVLVIVFRDFAILSASIALAVLSYEE